MYLKITLEGSQEEIAAIIQKVQWPFGIEESNDDENELPNVRINLKGLNIERFTDVYDSAYLPKEKRPEEYRGSTY